MRLNPIARKSPLLEEYRTIMTEINALEFKIKALNNTELRNKIFQLKKYYQEEQDLSKLIAQSFAITREASYRTNSYSRTY